MEMPTPVKFSCGAFPRGPGAQPTRPPNGAASPWRSCPSGAWEPGSSTNAQTPQRRGAAAALAAAATALVQGRVSSRRQSDQPRARRSVARNTWRFTVELPDLPQAPQLPDIGDPEAFADGVARELSSAVAAASQLPELVQSLPDLVARASQGELPPELAATLTELAGAAPAAPPTLAGAVLVGLLALRRGRQYYLEELPLRYDGPWIEAYWQRRPLRLAQRFLDVAIRAGGFSTALEVDKLLDREEEMMPQRAVEARDLITDLGPAFVKIVQVWASRPDVLPEPYQKELEGLLERVRPFGRAEAMETLRRNLTGKDAVEVFFDDVAAFDKPVASASIGQVYKAKVKGREVAVKVQRPDVREQVTLDLFVIRGLAALGSRVPIERYARQFQSLFELIDRAAPPFIEELDYKFEASNQQRFGELISGCDLVADTVAVPEVILAEREVLVQEWLPGKKLTEPGAAKDQAAKVVKVLLNSYMVQFLETGFLHGDPHPGNFVLVPDGRIGILDYGLMTSVTPDKRVAFIEYIVHVQAKMFDECLQDLINLEFLPAGIANDAEARDIIVPGLANTLTILFGQSDLRKQRELFQKQRDELVAAGRLEQLQEELRAIAKRYGSFRLPGYATLIIRALATLEGVGLRTNPNFSLTSELFPYIARRLLTDDTLRIREALRAYLYKGRTRIQVKRVDELVSGFRSFTNLMRGSREAAAQTGGAPVPEVAGAHQSADDSAAAGSPGAGVEMATKDIAAVIFSPQGNFLQEVLIDEGVAAIDALSRAAVVQLIRALGPLALPFTGPLALLLNAGDAGSRLLAREDKEALLLIRRLAQYVQGSTEEQDVVLVSEPGTSGGNDVREAAQALQRLQPLAAGVLPAVGNGASAFAERFARKLLVRMLQRVSRDIESSVGLRQAAAA